MLTVVCVVLTVVCVCLQRGSDELLSQTGGAVSNGGAMSPQPNHTDNNNDAKKVSLSCSRSLLELQVRKECSFNIAIYNMYIVILTQMKLIDRS